MKRVFLVLLLVVLLLAACQSEGSLEQRHVLLSDEGITVDGRQIASESFRGVHCARDIVYYKAGQGITYGEGEKSDEHTSQEADAHTVLHVTKPGCYRISGKLSLGQIAVDLGEGAENDPNAVVTLILDGVDLTCTVAPAVIFYRVYECGDKDKKDAAMDVDTSRAGAVVLLADGSVNNVRGSYVAKIFKSCELNKSGTKVLNSKKLHKYDGAFYARQSMSINGGPKGDGVLNVRAQNEGISSELHLSINGGVINVTSGNDGVNANEEGVSVITVNGGVLNACSEGARGEGDGVDSNGWLVINGGSVIAQACDAHRDAGVDSDNGIYLNGGRLVATGNTLPHVEGGAVTYACFSFASRQKAGQSYECKDAVGTTVGKWTFSNAFTYLIVAGDQLSPGEYTLWQGDTPLKGKTLADGAEASQTLLFSEGANCFFVAREWQ